jgi:hypothetical protein
MQTFQAEAVGAACQKLKLARNKKLLADEAPIIVISIFDKVVVIICLALLIHS